MKNIYFLLFSLLVGCSAIVNPDVGRINRDAGVSDAAFMGDASMLVDAAAVDAQLVPTDGDAGSVGGSCPSNDWDWTARARNTCPGPISVLSNVHVHWANMCTSGFTEYTIQCDSTLRTLRATWNTTRTGLVYESTPHTIMCEGVEYQIVLTYDALAREYSLDVSADFGTTWCQIDLE